MTDPLTFLFGLEQFGIKFGLDNMRAITARLGHPERSFRSIHIAGTNGKGSVTAMVDASLRAAGFRSARYTSPHLIHLEERFVIDGVPVSGAALVDAVARVRDAVEELRGDGTLATYPTFFEVTTAVAFVLFQQASVEVAAIEVGLGGRLDATNVLRPLATAITSIALDHEQYLGATLEAIAGEKAGIIKPGVPVVVGKVRDEAMRTIAAVAAERGAPLVVAPADVDATPVDADDDVTRIRLRTPSHDYGEVTIGLRGTHQIDNAVVAVRLLEVVDRLGTHVASDAIQIGLAQPGWPGRLDLRRLPDGREVLLDAAHNPAGAAALASYLHGRHFDGLPLVFAAMKDKDVEGILRALVPAVGPLVLTRASNPRSMSPEALVQVAHRIAPGTETTVADTPADALEIAWRISPRIIAAGSIFLLGDLMERLDRP